MGQWFSDRCPEAFCLVFCELPGGVGQFSFTATLRQPPAGKRERNCVAWAHCVIWGVRALLFASLFAEEAFDWSDPIFFARRYDVSLSVKTHSLAE